MNTPVAQNERDPSPAVTAYAGEVKSPQSEQSSTERRLATLLTGLFFAGLTVICLQPVFLHVPWLIFVQDDFLYYLKVAQNVVHGRGSTFNGVALTNGYQPLWLAILVVASYVATTGRAVLAFLAVANLLAAAATFVLTRSLLRSTGIRPLLAFALAALVTLYSIMLFFYGMEVTLTVPIVLGVVCLLRQVDWLSQTPLHTCLLGLLLSAMVLSRIDTLILGGIILGGILASSPLRALLTPTLLAGLAAGLLPLPAYFAYNRHVFHTWLPVSGMAKELKRGYIPSPATWEFFYHPVGVLMAIFLVVSLLTLWKIHARIAAIDRVLLAALILFPPVYYVILSCVSDWELWGWYMYPWRTALCASFLLVCLWPFASRTMQRPAFTYALVILVFAALFLMRWRRQQPDIYAASVEIQQFAVTHPGTYAMGDRSGRVSALIDNPIIQTEGLMMDRDFLERIKRQTPLRDTLSRYNAQYYIGTAYEPFTGCFQAAEPAKAGPTSAKMRAEFCEKPLATFVHDGVTTLIYGLDQAHPQ